MIYAALLTLAAAQAQAIPFQPTRAETEVTVRYSDLDLGSPHGRAKLNMRILEAARRVCDESPLISARHQAGNERCVLSVQKRARSDIEQALARQDSGRAVARNDVSSPARM